jgi:hypothetical protein
MNNGEITTDNQCRYSVEVVWEFQFDKDILAHNSELKHHPVVQHSPLSTRDALYGCRTETMVLNFAIRDGETIQYYDLVRLYPLVCNYFKFPVGHPKIHVGDACQDKQAMMNKVGLIKCTVLPPKRLYYSVLPSRCNNKFLCCLCKA